MMNAIADATKTALDSNVDMSVDSFSTALSSTTGSGGGGFQTW
jgi:hypothetical protein